MSTPSKTSENSVKETTSTGTQVVNLCCAEFKQTLSSDSSEANCSPYRFCRSSSKSSACLHSSHQHMKTAVVAKLLPAEHWAVHGLQQFDESVEKPLDVDQAHRIINDAFVKRLQEIELKAPTALDVKLATYKDWVSVLQRLNNVLLEDLEELEKTIEQHLNIHESRSNFGSRRDVATLVTYIRRAYHQNNWSFAGLKFETITPAEILGLNEKNPRDKEILDDFLSEKKNLSDQPRKDLPADSIKALVEEVARKHDQVGTLKNEICLLEEEIINAQKKIRLKDEHIRQLKNSLQTAKETDVQELTCKYCGLNQMAPTKVVDLTKALQPENEKVGNEIAKVDKDDKSNTLPELLNSSIFQNKNSFQEIRRINDLYIKLEFDRTQCLNRLNHFRDELLKILAPHSNVSHGLSVQFTDEMLLQAIHDRLHEFHTQRMELKDENDQLIKEKAETQGELLFLEKYKTRNDEVLRELSDLLTSMTGKVCCFEAICDSDKTFNPFCEAICGLQAQSSDKIGDLKAQLQREIEQRESLEKELTFFKNQLKPKNKSNVDTTTGHKATTTSTQSLSRSIKQTCTHI